MSTATDSKTEAAVEVDVELDSLAVQAAALGMAVATGEEISTKRVSKYKDRAAFVAAHPGVTLRIAAFDKKGTAATLMYNINKNDGPLWGRSDVTFKAHVAKPTADEVSATPEIAAMPFGVYVTAETK